VLLAVISGSITVPESQTGFEPGISQNNSAGFSRIIDIFRVGLLNRKIFSDGEAV